MTDGPRRALKQSLPTRALADYLARQIEMFFPDGETYRADDIAHFADRALARVADCFRPIWIHYYREGDAPLFNHLHTDHYATFLYLFANTVHREGGNPRLATKAYYLNKALHGLDVYHAVELPPVFLFVHPVGTVIGRAAFTDFFAVYQNCTVGGNLDLDYPSFGKGVVLFSGSRVIGACRVGSNCLIAAGASVIDRDIPDNSVAFGPSSGGEVRPTRHDVIARIFRFAV